MAQTGSKKSTSEKIPETDAIFDRIHQINQEADADETVLRPLGMPKRRFYLTVSREKG
ncbi:hypothetical protein KFU94_04770 [Chloroflexi bacterium TSY]|nr:hypothetical protein [Chloroflexi bacterium TSY]